MLKFTSDVAPFAREKVRLLRGWTDTPIFFKRHQLNLKDRMWSSGTTDYGKVVRKSQANFSLLVKLAFKRIPTLLFPTKIQPLGWKIEGRATDGVALEKAYVEFNIVCLVAVVE